MRTTKVLDTTAISAMLFEISSLNVLDRCCQGYDLLTTPAVMSELTACRRESDWGSSVSAIAVESPDAFDPTRLAVDLRKRYPGLHEGEIGAYLVALNRSVVTKKATVYITDDNLMRKKIKIIAKDPMVVDTLGSNFTVVDTGTIGVVLKLVEKGLVNDIEKVSIADDLQNSTFQCTDQILDRLRH